MSLIEVESYETRLISNPKKITNGGDNWREEYHHWVVTVNGVNVDFWTGVSHRTEKRKPNDGGYTYEQLRGRPGWDLPRLLELSKATPPKLDDVIHSLVLDSDASSMSFADWCDNGGYDTDSRKALATYEECQGCERKLREMKLGKSLQELQKLFQDY